MEWIEFQITTTKEHAETLSDELTLLGAKSLTFRDDGDEPIYEPSLSGTPLWQEVLLIALFDSSDPIESIQQFLEEKREAHFLKKIMQRQFPDEDWTRQGLKDFKAMHFGKRLWICPSWETPIDPTAVNVILDPGLGFGTGSHPTTALCLKWLDENIKGGETLVDYGCGSGILAIAALKLGAKKAYAIDHDPQALESAEKNAERNDVQLAMDFPKEPADLLVANILANPLVELAPQIQKLVKIQGKIALSGILISQVDQVIQAYQPWFSMDPPLFQDEWVRLSGVKRI